MHAEKALSLKRELAQKRETHLSSAMGLFIDTKSGLCHIRLRKKRASILKRHGIIFPIRGWYWMADIFFKHPELPFVECRYSTDSRHHYKPHMHKTFCIGAIDLGEVV
jgi:hypothetical protein